MKRLFLMRHGHALTPGEAGVGTDALRPLSDKGCRDVPRMAAELARREGAPALILHSPLRRAEQTAALAAAALKGAAPQVFTPLDNTLPPDQVLEHLHERAGRTESVLAIGHQPQLGELAALLGSGVLDIRPGGVVALEIGAKPRLLWSLNPEEL
ncbi:MAG: histidine phosphatase family protein [Elusimicrobiota bacterium]|nr:histidine phosphatase family protein [Elusimicrobiota bacterium]